MPENAVNTRVPGIEKNEFQNKNLTSMEGVGILVFGMQKLEVTPCRNNPAEKCSANRSGRMFFHGGLQE